MLIGSHVSMSGKKMLLGAAEEAASYQATTFMIYRRNADRSWTRFYDGKRNFEYRRPCPLHH